MKVSTEWLGEFIEGPLPEAARLGDILTMGGFPVENIETVGPDTVLDVEVTSNRVDCLSVRGVARELSALANFSQKPSSIAKPGASQHAAPATVRIDAPDLCPHYTARVIKGIKVGPSPAWMQRRLLALGQRPINNIVDITNYVLFETGQPLHAFDLAQVRAGSIVVRRAGKGETIVTLDGQKRTLDESMLVIADAERPLVVAGIMGGEDSVVTDSTVDVLIEAARFDPLATRRTSRTLGLASDSSYRFERGLDPTGVVRASDRCVELILQIAGGAVVGPIVEAGASGYAPRTLVLRMSELERVLGIAWPPAQCAAALDRLGFVTRVHADRVEVEVPSHRLDVTIEVDLIEEVARVIGYDKIPTADEVPIRLPARDDRLASIELIRRTMNAAGFFEALTFSFVSDHLADAFTEPGCSLHRVEERTRRADNRLRPSVLPGLLESIRLNENAGTTDAKLFEIASTFWIDAAGASRERRTIGIVGSDDYASLRGSVERLLTTLDARRTIRVEPATRAGFGKNACGKLLWNGTEVGHLGKLDRSVAERLGLRGLVAIAELDVDALVAGTAHVPQLAPLPKYPGTTRDVSLLVSESTRYQQLEAVVTSLRLPDLESLSHAGTYRGKPLAPGTKSVTLTLRFRSPTGTLVSESVDASMKKLVDAMAGIGATLRT